MAHKEQPPVPIWMEAKARKRVDVLKEAARTVEESDRVRANQPIADMTERDLEAEQLRLEELLRAGTINVEHFRRLREIDFYLDSMRERRYHGPIADEWESERYTE